MKPTHTSEIAPAASQTCTLEDALADWLELVESDALPDEAGFLARFPHLTEELSRWLTDWRKARPLLDLLGSAGFATRPGDGPNLVTPLLGLADETARQPEALPTVPDHEVECELGRGGMGVVFKARQVSLGRWVAIKMLRGTGPEHAQDLARFQNEAAIVAQLDHQNIVPIYQIGETQGRLYFSMRWIEGGSLADHLKAHPEKADRAAQRRAAQMVAAAARAVHYAHERGVLHRDLKPSNVLLDGKGFPHVTDFGLAKRLDGAGDTTRTGEFVGTPSYMTPEQAAGEKNTVTTATDVHGLGGVLYALLTGNAPFQADTLLETLQFVKEREPIAPSRLNPAADRDLQTICLKCLQKAPQHRYPSAAALADDLDRWLAGEPIVARPPAVRERLVRWVRRQPAVAGLIVLSIATLVAFIAGLLIYNSNIGQALAETESLRTAGLKREAELRRHLYIADLRAARQHLDSGEDDQALALSRRHLPESGEEDLRGFEWHQTHAVCSYKPRILGKHDAPVVVLAVSPDSHWLAAGDKKGGLKIWDVRAGKEARTLAGPKHEVAAVAFSRDGRRLAAAVYQEWLIRFWEVGTWKDQEPLVGFFSSAPGLAFSPDNSALAAAHLDGATRVWKFGHLLPAMLRAKGLVRSVDWSRDGKQLLTAGSEGQLKVWDVTSGREAFELPRVSTGTVLSAAYHPHKPWAASGGFSRHVSLWDLSTRVETVCYTASGSVRQLQFAPDGASLAAAGGDGEICLLHLPSDGRGHRVARICRDGNATIHGLAFLHSGRTLATGAEDGFIKLWDIARLSGVEVRQMPNQLRRLSDSGRFAVTAAPRYKTTVHDLASGEAVGETVDYLHHLVESAFSPSEKLIAFVTAAEDVALWDFRHKQPHLRITQCRGKVNGLAISPDEETLAIGEKNGAIWLWSARSGKPIVPLRIGRETVKVRNHVLRFTPDGKTLVSALAPQGEEITLWDVASLTPRATLRVPGGEVQSLTVSRDGRLLAAGVGQRLIQLWDLDTGEAKASLGGNNQQVYALTFSPDNKTLASAYEDGTIRLWNLETGHLLFTLHTCRLVPLQLEFDAEGGTLTGITNSPSEAEVLIWRLPPSR